MGGKEGEGGTEGVELTEESTEAFWATSLSPQQKLLCRRKRGQTGSWGHVVV